jgi:hypothetical protein
MKGVWKVHGTTFRSSMCWYARMLRKSVMWRLLKRNRNLFRQSFFSLFLWQVSSLATTHFCRLFLRFFTENRGWTLPALFSILRDLRDLAFDVGFSVIIYKLRFRRLIFLFYFYFQADYHAKYNGQKSECMEESARIIAKAFGNCMTDRCSAFQHTAYFLILVKS